MTWAEDITWCGSPYNINDLLGLDYDDRLGHRLWSVSYTPHTPLSIACAFVLQFLMNDFDVLSPVDWNRQLSRGSIAFRLRTLLDIAAEEGQTPTVHRLLEKGVGPDSKDEDGMTALLRAAENGHEAAAKLLLKKGADLESRSDDDQMILSHHILTNLQLFLDIVSFGPQTRDWTISCQRSSPSRSLAGEYHKNISSRPFNTVQLWMFSRCRARLRNRT